MLSSWRIVRHHIPSQPRDPLERRKSTVRLLPSGPDPVSMMKIRNLPSGKSLQSPATPRDRISQLKCGLDSPLGAPPPVVAPPKGGWGLQGTSSSPAKSSSPSFLDYYLEFCMLKRRLRLRLDSRNNFSVQVSLSVLKWLIIAFP